jgi:type IV pilus assembly protein PilA
MMWLRKSKKGFTLIELMVVVAIIGVLSLLGLRFYAGQQEKAKNAVVKANAGTIQTLIQAELADDSSYSNSSAIALDAGIQNPYDGTENGATVVESASDTTSAGTEGRVGVMGGYSTSDSAPFYIVGYGKDGAVCTDVLRAQR